MKKNKAYCEPFCLQEGYQFEINQVSYDEQDGYSCFMHFHEVHELIIFNEIDGSYFYSQGESKLIDNDLVFTPGLETHDFELSNKPKSWSIIQFLPTFLTDNGLYKEAELLKQGMHLRLPTSQLNNIECQVKWLQQSFEEDPLSNKSLTLLKLLLIWVFEYAEPLNKNGIKPITHSSGYERLAPVVNMFKQNSYVELSLVEAAELCHVSTSYFSRLFKRVFRSNYSEYTVKHKLYSAARLLTQSNMSVTDISYELHFSNPSHFIALFRKEFAITPKKYRMNLEKRIK